MIVSDSLLSDSTFSASEVSPDSVLSLDSSESVVSLSVFPSAALSSDSSGFSPLPNFLFMKAFNPFSNAEPLSSVGFSAGVYSGTSGVSSDSVN